MSESLRRELMIFGVDVIIVAPGNVATPIWDKAEAVDDTPFDNTPYAPALARSRAMRSKAAGRACRRRGSAKRSRPRSPPPAKDTLYRCARSDPEPDGRDLAEAHRGQHDRASAGAEVVGAPRDVLFIPRRRRIRKRGDDATVPAGSQLTDARPRFRLGVVLPKPPFPPLIVPMLLSVVIAPAFPTPAPPGALEPPIPPLIVPLLLSVVIV